MTDIRVRANQYTVGDFLGWKRTGDLSLSPNFQRRPVWSPIAKSYLIDTIVRGFPVPIIILRQRSQLKAQATREVVDGQQRLRTLISYIDPNLLSDLGPNDNFTIQTKHNKELAGLEFHQLTQEIQDRILNYEFSVQTLPAQTSDREVLEIFARLNSTGLKLNHQELRNAEFSGFFKTAVYDLALRELDRWRAWRLFSETDIARMNEVELVSELVFLMFEGVTGKKQKAIDDLYRKKDEQFKEQEEVSRRFTHTIDALDGLLGPALPSSVFARGIWIYTLFAHIYDVAYGLKSPLTKRTKPQPVTHLKSCLKRAAERAERINPSDELYKFIRGATAHAPSRNARLKFIRTACKRA